MCAAPAIDEFGHIDVLVNNAGVFRTVPVMETTEEVWDEQLDLNLKGETEALTRLVLLEHGRENVMRLSCICDTARTVAATFHADPGYERPTIFVLQRVRGGKPLLFLLKHADDHEDSPGSVITIYSGNHGDSRNVARRPALTLHRQSPW